MKRPIIQIYKRETKSEIKLNKMKVISVKEKTKNISYLKIREFSAIH